MDVFFWYQIVGAVLAGNALTFMFGYYIWRCTKQERNGLDTSYLPLYVHLCGIIPPGVVIFGLYYLVRA